VGFGPLFVYGWWKVATAHDKLTQLVASAVEPLGYELLGLEYISQGHHSVIRVFIDLPRGILLEDCERASHQISAVLDVEDPISSEYSLEVSSPGLDRPLFTLAHFARFLGQAVKLRLHVPVEGRRKFSGTILGIEDDRVRIGSADSDEQWLFSMQNIEKANLIAEF